MRGDATRPSRNDEQGRVSPTVHANGQPTLGVNTSFPVNVENTLHPPTTNGATGPHGRTSSFSYSSVLASSPSVQSPSLDTGGNGVSTNHSRPFKYSREEMLNIWKSNAPKFKGNGIPLEFEKHDPFTSEETLEPALLSEMTAVEKEVCSWRENGGVD